MDIPSISLENLINNLLKIISGESSSLIPVDLKNQLQLGKVFQGKVLNILPKGKATISIEGQKIIAELPPDANLNSQKNSKSTLPDYPIKSGQQIYLQVEKINPELVFKFVLAPQKKFQEQGYKTNLSRNIKSDIIKFENVSNLKLPTDKIVRGTVNQIKNQNWLSVKFADQEVLVKTENTNFHRVGEKVQIQFQQVAKGFKPILIDCHDKAEKIDLEIIKPYLPSRKPLGDLVGELSRDILDSPVLKELIVRPEVLERLRDTLKALTPKLEDIPNELDIKGQVDKSGIRYESKIKQLLTQPKNSKIKIELAKDLKGQLLELIQAIDKPAKSYYQKNQNRIISEFQQRIKIAVDSIELNQLSSRLSKQENQPLVLQIPNPLSSNDKTIQLFIREDSGSQKKDREAEKGFYDLAFFLELSSLGNIKIKAKVGPENLVMRIDVEHEDVASFILKNATDFEKRMKDKELNTTLECFVAEKVSPVNDNLIELLVSKNTSLLSVKT